MFTYSLIALACTFCNTGGASTIQDGIPAKQEQEQEMSSREYHELLSYSRIIGNQEFIEKLELSPEQRKSLNTIRGEIGLMVSLYSLNDAMQNVPPPSGTTRPVHSTAGFYKKLQGLKSSFAGELLPHQIALITQHNTFAVLDNFELNRNLSNKLLNSLNLTEDQIKEIKKIRLESAEEAAEAKREFDMKKDKIEGDSWEKILNVMTPKQKQILKQKS